MTFGETIRTAEIQMAELVAEAERHSTPIGKTGVTARLAVLANLQTRLATLVTLLEAVE